MSDYHINIFYSEEDSGYIADMPDLDSCSAFGETPEKALEELEKAKKAWIEAGPFIGQTHTISSIPSTDLPGRPLKCPKFIPYL